MALKPRGAKQKGDKYERELAAYFNQHVFDGRDVVFRAPLSGGGSINFEGGGADLNGTQDLFVEAKRVEKLNIRDALRQAESNLVKRDMTALEMPVVINRRNGETTGQSVVSLRLDDFLCLYRHHLAKTGHLKDSE